MCIHYSFLYPLPVTDDVALTMTQLADFAQLCIEFMYELHDYYWEDFTQYTQVMIRMTPLMIIMHDPPNDTNAPLMIRITPLMIRMTPPDDAYYRP